MLYPLFPLHQLIDELTQPAQATAGEAQHHLPVIQKAATEALAFPLSFMQQAAGAKNSKALQVLVHTCQAGCTSLLDRVSTYVNALHNATGTNSAMILSAAKTLEEHLLNGLLYLQQHFPAYFNKEQLLPQVYRQQVQMKLELELQSITALWQNSSPCPELQTIALAPVQNFISAQSASPCSFQQLDYFRSLLSALAATGSAHTAGSANQNIIDTLVRLNFNDAALLQYIMQYLYRQINNTGMHHDQANQWALYEKHFGQVYIGGSALLPGSPSAQASLVSMIQQEIKYLHQQQNTLAAIYGSQPGVPATPKSTILTNLSVSQLAVLIRLLTDCKIIEHSNQAELLRMVAGAFKTTRATHISADSLSSKFYSPDTAAINIIKEHLNQMLTCLRKY